MDAYMGYFPLPQARGEAQAALQSARAMGMEAASEPRFWKLFLGFWVIFSR